MNNPPRPRKLTRRERQEMLELFEAERRVESFKRSRPLYELRLCSRSQNIDILFNAMRRLRDEGATDDVKADIRDALIGLGYEKQLAEKTVERLVDERGQ